MQLAAEGFDVAAWFEAQVDPVEAAQAVETPLRAADIHHRDALAVRTLWQQSCNLERDGPGADLDVELVALFLAQPFRSRWAQQHGVGIEKVENHAGAFGQQRRLYLRCAQRIEAEKAQAVLASGQRHFEVERGIRRFDLWQPRDAGIEILLESRARSADDQVAFACDVTGGQLELVDRARVDEMNRDPERYAQRDREDGEHAAAWLLAQRTEDKRAEQGKHHNYMILLILLSKSASGHPQSASLPDPPWRRRARNA